MTAVVEEGKEGTSLAASLAEANAERRACANSVALPPPGAPGVVTDSIRRTAETVALAARFGAAMANKPGSLYFSQPPTFAQARDRHHECAGHFGAPALKLLRLIWGYVHLLLIKPALNLAEWLTESPARFAVAMALAAAIWIFG